MSRLSCLLVNFSSELARVSGSNDRVSRPRYVKFTQLICLIYSLHLLLPNSARLTFYLSLRGFWRPLDLVVTIELGKDNPCWKNAQDSDAKVDANTDEVVGISLRLHTGGN